MKYYFVNHKTKEVLYTESPMYEIMKDGFSFLGSSDFENIRIIVANLIGRSGNKEVTGYTISKLED